MANQDPNQERPGRILDIQEVPGDTNSGDIVGPTGEQMPRQSHDGVVDDDRARSTKQNDEGREQRSPDRDTSAGRHDNPRTGRISDW